MKTLEADLVDQLGAIASENGQDLEGFVQSALTQIVNNHAARKETGLGGTNRDQNSRYRIEGRGIAR